MGNAQSSSTNIPTPPPSSSSGQKTTSQTSTVDTTKTGAPPPKVPVKHEMILDNGFKSLPKFLQADFPHMAKAMTFDERGLLSVTNRKSNIRGGIEGTGPNLQRAVTFIDKEKVQRRHSFALEDVMYRMHFGNESEKRFPVLPVHEIPIDEIKVQEPAPLRNEAVVIVDTFSTGLFLAYLCHLKGFRVISATSGDLQSLAGMIPEGLNFNFSEVIPYPVELDETEAFQALTEQLSGLPWKIVAIVPGAETGVELADQLSSHFGLRTNGTAQSEARRNKYVMGETIRSAGIRAVKQLQSQTWSDIANFLHEWQPNPYRVIVKPMDSAGSDDVTLCRSEEEVQRAFGHILGKVNGLGLVNNSVLVQEYLEGQEYVIDMVSRDGEHKLVGIWEYDRRPANGASFVLYGQQLMIMSDHPEIYTELVEYQKKVLTALGVRNGPSHGEVKWFQGAPVLVEVGSRCHGSEGAWIPVADGVLRYNQVGATVASYLSDEAFAQIPPLTTTRYQDGRMVFLQCNKTGILRSINSDILQEIRGLKSFICMEVFLKLGQKMTPTINCFTFGGFVVLVHPDPQQVLADYERIHEIEVNLFEGE